MRPARTPGSEEGGGCGREPTRPCSCLIAHPGQAAVLLFDRGGQWELPGAAVTGLAVRNPTAACRRALAEYGIGDLEAFPIRFARLFREHLIFECETGRGDRPLPAGGRWISHGEFEKVTLRDPTIGAVLRTWFREYDGPPKGRAPWERRGWWREALEWVQRQAPAGPAFHFDRADGGKVCSSWNFALPVCSAERRLWFKAVRVWSGYEPRLTATLCRLFPGDVPEVIAADEARGWLLMEEFERHFRETGEDKKLLHGALGRFAELQVESLEYLDAIAETGVPDLRCHELDEIAGLFSCVGGIISACDDANVADCRPDVPRACETAKRAAAGMCELGIPHALVHGDFTWINIALKAGGRGYVFFDWGESCISHPFISIAKFAEYCAEWEELLPSYLEPWAAYGSREKLLAAFESAGLLNQVHRIRRYVKICRDAEAWMAAYALRCIAGDVRDLAEKA